MCTVTLHRAQAELLVTMNRDELRGRAPEHPPLYFGRMNPQVRWVMPIDGESGGTWMGANSEGVVACLLNAYQPGESSDRASILAAGTVSRGKIVPEALFQGPETAVEAWLHGVFDPSPFSPFSLVVAGPEQTVAWSWNGQGRILRTPLSGEWVMESSSSLDAARVLPYRERLFETWIQEGARFEFDLPSFHLQQVEGRAEWSPFMSRELSSTRSITQARVEIARGILALRYWSNPEANSLAPPPTSVFHLPLAHPHPAHMERSA